MSKCFVTGCEGFIGSYLAEFLLDRGLSVYGTIFNDTGNIDHLKDKITAVDCDVTKKERLIEVVSEIKPDYVFHLAAQSFVIPSWEDPEYTLRTNIFGTLYLLDAIRETKIDPIIAVVCSSAEYGLNYQDEIPTKETKEFRPQSPYAVSKIGADMVSFLYYQAYSMKIFRIRLFNTTGPRKILDACSDFSRGIVEVEKGYRSALEVGNLEGIRDITDVRDAVRALWLITEKGTFGEVYNICSGKGYLVRDILDKLLSFAKVEIKVHQDVEKMRPLDDPIFIGDNSKISAFGWKPEVSLEETLSSMLDYWRRVL